MRWKDYYRLAWDQLKRRIVVTSMCALGIAIGSASIIVALAFGESVTHYSEQQMGYYMKTDEITVMPQRRANAAQPDKVVEEPITQAKMDIIRELPHVKSVASYGSLGSFSYTVDGGKKGYINELIATELDTLEAFGYEFQQGGAGGPENVMILSYGATVNLFDEKQSRLQAVQAQQAQASGGQERQPIPYPVYQKQVLLEARSYSQAGGVQTQPVQIPVRVIGVLKKPEGVPSYMIESQRNGYITPSLASKIRSALGQTANGGTEAGKGQLKVKIDETANVDAVDASIKKLKVDTSNNLHQKERMNSEFVIIRLIFAGVGLFVLFVASISIVVAMTMSTYQRRRQIGIMKVLGANLKQIRNMFIVESGMLGLIGGVIGILVSYWVIWGINVLVIRFANRPQSSDPELMFISLWVLPVGLLFALMTGILSGIYPAVKASRTDALTAIKRE